ncbi:MAG: hypothetical protein ACFFAH_09650 [Promethearchaeota archaeon]
MKRKNNAISEEKQKKCRLGLWLSKSEKVQLKKNAEKEHFSTISQFIRHRCLNDTITNSELADKLMSYIGQKFLEEDLKNIKPIKEKVYTKEMLKEPRKLYEFNYEPPIHNSLTKKRENKVIRDSYFNFTLSKAEKEQLKNNATKKGFRTMSKFIRNRCLREQISNNEIISMIRSFMVFKLMEWSVVSERNLERRKQKLKSQVNLSPILAGLSKDKRVKLESHMKELAETYSDKIQEELSSILSVRKFKLEKALAC